MIARQDVVVGVIVEVKISFLCGLEASNAIAMQEPHIRVTTIF